jgi:4-hydroxybenzoate polyprenyltransferase
MKKIISVLSSRNWGIIRYNSVWQNLAALFYIALAAGEYNLVFIGQVFLFLTFSTIMTGFGYLVNDLSDKELDRQQGKPNAFQNMSSTTAVFFILLTLLVGMIVAIPFLSLPWFAVLWLFWVLLAVFYSLPPMRLKERGLLGLTVTIAAQQTLPVAILFATFGELLSWGALVFILFATLRGISSDISHQMRDSARDAEVGTQTFAVQAGNKAVQRVYTISLELERLALGAVILLLLLELPAVQAPLWEVGIAIAWPIALFYLPLLLLTIGSSFKAFRRGKLEREDPYDEARQAAVRDAVHVIHHPLPSVILPLYLAVWLALFYWPNVIFILVLFLLYGLYSPKRWAAAWPIRPLLSYLRRAEIKPN